MSLKKYPTYKKSRLSNVGMIPAQWIEKRAKYLFSEVDERSETGTEEMLSVSHLRGVVRRKLLNVTMFQAESNKGLKLCQTGDVVINTMWAWMAALGTSKELGLVSPSYGVYRLHQKSAYYPDYLDYLLRIEAYRAEYMCRSTGVRSSRLRLYPDKFLDIPILCPPYKDQEAIVRYLKSKTIQINKIIQKKKRLIELLKEQKQVIINQAVTRGLDSNVCFKPSGIDWLGDIPEHWALGRLKDFVRIKNGQDHKDFEVAQGYPVIGSGGPFSFSSKFLYNGESVLLGRKGTIDKPIYINGPFWTIDTMFYTEIKNNLFAKFLFYCTQGFQFKHYSTQTALPSMTQQDLGKHPLQLPPLDEQHRIVLFLEKATKIYDHGINKFLNLIKLIEEYRSRLISDVVTGKIDVGDIVVGEIAEEELIDEIMEEEQEEEPLALIGAGDDD